MNRKLTAMNKLLMEENDRLQKQVSQLVHENSYFRQHTPNVRIFIFNAFLKNKEFHIDFCFIFWLQPSLPAKDTSCESVVTSGQHQVASLNPPRDASPAGLVLLVREHVTLLVTQLYYISELNFVCLQTFVHCRRNFSRVSFKGNWNRC